MGRTALPPDLNDRILAEVRRSPRITIERLAVRLNFVSRRVIEKRVAQLETEGKLRSETADLGSGNRFAKLLYAAEYQPPQKKLFQPASVHQNEVRTWIDPSVIGSCEPQRGRSSIGDPPTAVPWKPSPPIPVDSPVAAPATEPPSIQTPEKEAVMSFEPDTPAPQRRKTRSAGQKHALVSEQIRNMVNAGQVWTRNRICTLANVSSSYFGNCPEAQAEYDRAVADIRGKAPTNPQQEQQELEQYRQQLADLEARNRELRQQLVASQHPVEDLYLESLRKDEQHWKDSLKRIEAEAQQLEQDREAALANLYACQRLIASKTGTEDAPRFEMVVPNGNGKGVAYA